LFHGVLNLNAIIVAHPQRFVKRVFEKRSFFRSTRFDIGKASFWENDFLM